MPIGFADKAFLKCRYPRWAGIGNNSTISYFTRGSGEIDRVDYKLGGLQ